MTVELAAAYERGLARALPRGRTVCVGLSGGMDSCALLHAAMARRDVWPVVACHVNHGLSARADGWERFCKRLCEEWEVQLRVRRADAAPARAGEDWAREARLRAFGELVTDGFADAVALAHHADDAAETVLFRLLRGCGAAGAGGMDATAQVRATAGGAAVTVVRPWLEARRECIAAYAAARRLRWVEDEDNFNAARRRNFLRMQGLPALAAGFENASANVAASGRRLREGAALLRQLAQQDEAAARRADGGMDVAFFAEAGAARLRNWLYFAARERRVGCGERQLDEMARQILAGGGCRIAFDEWELHCWRGGLFWARRLPVPPVEFAREVTLSEGEVALRAVAGRLLLRRAAGEGLSLIKTGGRLVARLRQGGEKLAPCGRPRRLVAKLLQEAGVPPWRRPHVPLLYAGDQLAAVAGVAVAAAFAAQAGETGVVCEWRE